MLIKTADRLSRRSLLDLGAKAAATFGVSSLLSPVSSAATLERACVCVYLLGGNDSNNMIVPLDSPAYEAYAAGRGALALPAASLLPIKAWDTSANYGLHPALAGLQNLYNQGVLSVVANVGRMDQPLAKGQFDVRRLPADLFSHAETSQVRYTSDGLLELTWDSNVPAVARPARVTVNARESLSRRLAKVATELGRKGPRGVHTLSFSGFDTHADELNRQAVLFEELNGGLVSFYRTLHDMGMADRVTVFTMTEFNRALVPNAKGGTAHAWGGHNLVLGGSVRGGQVYGRFPSLAVGGPDDLGTTGVWIPSVSQQQYSATIARWYGIDDLATVFPQLGNFPQREMGFLPA